MKVAHIVEAFSSGIVTFIKNLTEGIEYEHTIFYAQRELNINTIKNQFHTNVKFVNWVHAKRKINLFNDLIAAFELYRFLKAGNYDAIHLHSSKAGVLGRIVGLFFLDKKIIYTPNGASFARKDISYAKVFMYKAIEYCSNLLCGEVVCVSLSESIAFSRIGVKTIFINNGINVKTKTKSIKSNSKFKIVTVGRISDQKSPHLFNKIAENLTKYPIKFLWIGDGELKSMLSSPNITVTGWISSSEVEAKLLDCDLYLSTALWEGLPFAVLEAMNCKLPLLLSNCIGNVDLVDVGSNGYIFNTSEDAINHIVRYLNSNHILIQHGENSYIKLFNYFNSNDMCMLYKNLYTKDTQPPTLTILNRKCF